MGRHPGLPRCNHQLRLPDGSTIPPWAFRSKSLARFQFNYLPLVSYFRAALTSRSVVFRELDFIHHWEYHFGRDLGNKKPHRELEGNPTPLTYMHVAF